MVTFYTVCFSTASAAREKAYRGDGARNWSISGEVLIRTSKAAIGRFLGPVQSLSAVVVVNVPGGYTAWVLLAEAYDEQDPPHDPVRKQSKR